MYKNFLYIFIIFIFIGCSSKEDYVLFINNDEKPKLNKDYPFMQERIYIKKPAIKNISLKNIRFEYKITPGDRISVRVYKHPEFSTINEKGVDNGVIVDEDGYINLLLVGRVKVGDLSENEALKKITQAFGEYLKYPSVQIDILNKKAYILGEVKRPGEIKIDRNKLSLLKLIAKAGDLTDNANRRKILIFKQHKDNLQIQTVNLLDYNSLKMANLTIEPNDIVYVTPNNMKAFNVKVKDIDPIFSLISHILQPFVNIKYLSE